MKINCRRVHFQRMPACAAVIASLSLAGLASPVQRMPACAAVIASLSLAGLASPVVARAQDQPQHSIHVPLKEPTLDSTIDVLDVRDAPVRQTLEMVMEAGRGQFSVDGKTSGYVSLKTPSQSLRKALDAICSASLMPLAYKVERGVYFISPKPSNSGELPLRQPLVQTANLALPVPVVATDVPRRVAAILIMADGPSYAILETGAPGASATDVRVVAAGAESIYMSPTRVPSGVRGIPDLTVTAIDADGLTLTAKDGSTIRVPLASIPSPASHMP